LHGVRNGNLGTIERIEPTTRTIHARLDDGKSVRFSLNDYEHVRLGYAVTTHKSQGMTAKNAYILAGGAMQDRELSYVQVSRAKELTRIYTDKVEAGDKVQELARRMSVSRQKDLATTLTPEVRVQKMELRWGR
jgi:ATP-dependent exoDNAse (exonuclease V) alpha subunit